MSREPHFFDYLSMNSMFIKYFICIYWQNLPLFLYCSQNIINKENKPEKGYQNNIAKRE